MSLLIYFIKEAVRGFYQAKLMTFVAIVTISSSLFLMSGIGIAFLNVQNVIRRSTGQADIAAYLKDDVFRDSSALAALLTTVKANQKIQQVTLINKEEAWSRFEQYYGAEMLESVDDNPLPASLEIVLAQGYQSSDAAATLKTELEKINGVESVQYSREWMDLVARFKWYFYVVSSLVSIVLVLILHFMIANTIKLTIYARRELVRNMHFVGATDLFIKLPFILEGMLQGFLGGVISVMLIAILKTVLMRFSLTWGGNGMPFIIISAGVLFGWIGSVSAVRKFLV
jgi:cell division transport system permease protein